MRREASETTHGEETETTHGEETELEQLQRIVEEQANTIQELTDRLNQMDERLTALTGNSTTE